MNIKFLPLGGADEIGASCYYLNIEGTGILLDCGIHPRKIGYASLPNLDILKNLPVDFCIVTHAHQDHIGALPILIKQYPHVRIYATKQTVEIAEYTLHNAVKILRESLGDTPELLYTHEEVDLLVRSMIDYRYNETFEIIGLRHNSNETIKVRFYDAGHILGSASVLLEHEGKRIFYTGDINFNPQSLMQTALPPSKPVDILITESTYGAKTTEDFNDWDKESDRFINYLNSIINKGGSVLVPVFALGKTQELLSTLHKKLVKRKLTDTTFYTGGLGTKINKLYDKNRFLVNYSDPEFELSNIEQTDAYQINDLQTYVKNPGIVLVSSGMLLRNTFSYSLLLYWLNQSKFGIAFVGYLDPESPGYKVLNAGTGNKVELSESMEVKCSIEKFSFTAHARGDQLISLAEHLKPSRIILVHGTDEAKDTLGFKLLQKFPNIKLNSAAKLNQIEIKL
ncbi:MAG: MBL fold metallo-hydrolase [Melioribacteraceae bacterium]|nr:exonuclease [Ignavibacteriota bacterium]MBZ0182227.1 MBL fold metallo-hydrolase [Melioribacteraceae bacterium]